MPEIAGKFNASRARSKIGRSVVRVRPILFKFCFRRSPRQRQYRLESAAGAVAQRQFATVGVGDIARDRQASPRRERPSGHGRVLSAPESDSEVGLERTLRPLMPKSGRSEETNHSDRFNSVRN